MRSPEDMASARRMDGDGQAPGPSLGTVTWEWGRIGCIGFGGPPARIKLLRDLCVERRA